MPTARLVPDDFAVPAGLRTGDFVLEPLAEVWPFTNPDFAAR